MPKIISFYSFRDGTGKSTIVANLAAAIARKTKYKVGIIETNLSSPGLHYLFPGQERLDYLNHYLKKECSINKAAYKFDFQMENQSFNIDLIPASPKMGDIAQSLNLELDDQYPKYIYDGFNTIIENLNIDYLLVDCPAGIREQTLLPISISNTIVIVLRPDIQDLQETTMSLEIAEKLSIPKKMLIMNQAVNNEEELTTELHKFFHRQATVAGILPTSEKIIQFSIPKQLQNNKKNTSSLFYVENPEDPWSKKIEKIANKIIA
ncbi:MinD/ParA family protein [Anabaena sp. UHCC 0253]|uniref:MinD/ParA family ATP-binding protein n=1 Tax=Anabaena sp. UHCC 0253 TaxID=2590019 RepID=UPI0014479D47|nr:MinD/ParA family protein [Anabaena sp. UHCC 0253]MTJ51927.1 MinD/ParA family protein [Anabaena sp. UHCC 0253]